MTWEYEVTSCLFYRNGTPKHRALYAGARHYYNDPSKECVSDKGPLPRGKYTIGAPHYSEKTGKYTLDLTPHSSNAMCGRFAFKIHGESARNPGGASQGCIIAVFSVRKDIWDSGDRELVVR
ncbi:tlde1 domain-containing protein [Chimaeribacter arupi]|uniref:tlde1 domain-containing protein n=1 Tax=Chimaeribacter arupi TaxID=2060066 RepID=UPI000C7A05F8|nr:tlde1 domain-containing protein [Chimaeribacter arupi]PLR36687.1 DUF2778 domain-containing protein [Chimaeribacter arupi]PLR42615.1 DUF2778 domain-containing protein [Chimaeribacter arupi]